MGSVSVGAIFAKVGCIIYNNVIQLYQLNILYIIGSYLSIHFEHFSQGGYEVFSKNTSLRDIYEAEHLSPIKDCLVSGGNFFAVNGHLSLSELQAKNPTWFADDILYGLKRLKSSYEVHKTCEDISVDLSGLGLIWFPARAKKRDTYFILLAGGAYGAVCTMVEALPVAARLNELGYDCFCLNYRTATQASFTNGLFPKPMDDLAAAIIYIDKNKKHFGVTPNDYALVGFSAGGHLASTW